MNVNGQQYMYAPMTEYRRQGTAGEGDGSRVKVFQQSITKILQPTLNPKRCQRQIRLWWHHRAAGINENKLAADSRLYNTSLLKQSPKE
jgi:hypothetical protein